MTAGDRALSVGGNAIGQFSTGDHNVLVTANASLVQINQAGPRAKPKRRERIERLPSRVVAPLGRAEETALLLRSVAGSEPVQVYGVEGIGKSTLIRHATLELNGHDGVVFLDGYGKEPEDLLQSLFEACYDCPGHRPSEAELHTLLADLRLCLVIDDFDGPSRELVRIQDAIPAGTVLVGSGERTLWGRGTALELTGLPQTAARQLLTRELRRELRPEDAADASLLWQASQGHPFKLLRAAALARRDADTGVPRLPSPVEIPELLHELVASASNLERDILALLSVAPTAEVSIDLLSVLLAPFATGDAVLRSAGRLTFFGLLTRTDQRVRLFPDARESLLDNLTQNTAQLADATFRLTAWAAARRTPAAAVAGHAPLISAWIEEIGRAGRADLGVKLARAAAPAAACSLRWGAWGRILTRGTAAADQAGDGRARAYFAHENGVRSLLTGKRMAAAAAFAVAAAAWRSFGDHGSAGIAEHGGTIADPHGTTTGPPGHPDSSIQAAHDPSVAVDPGQANNQSVDWHGHDGSSYGPQPGNPGHPATSQSPPPHAQGSQLPPGGGYGGGGFGGGTAKSGLTLTAKLVIGAALLAVGGGSVWVLGQGGESEAKATIPLRVQVATDIFEVSDLPGTTEGSCRIESGRTDCTKVVQVAKGEKGPVTVVPGAPLPEGVQVVYWGCAEGPSAANCTVTANEELTICVTTTSPQDADARDMCATSTGTPKMDSSTSPSTKANSRDPQPTFDPCALLTPADLVGAADDLAQASELRRVYYTPPETEPHVAFGHCIYEVPGIGHRPVDPDAHFGYQPIYNVEGDNYYKTKNCTRIDITDDSWLCHPVGDQHSILVNRADGAQLSVYVNRHQQGEFSTFDEAASRALMQVVLSRI
ncbi:hypothetical protein ACWEKT_33040 [Nocardia takedensis]